MNLLLPESNFRSNYVMGGYHIAHEDHNGY